MNKIKESELNILLEEGELCDYCPYVRGEISNGPYDLCEGLYCEQAKDIFPIHLYRLSVM